MAEKHTKNNVLRFTIKVLKFFYMFPKNENIPVTKMFYAEYGLILLLASTELIGCLLHVAISIINNSYDNQYSDMVSLSTLIAGYLTNVTFVLNAEYFRKLLEYLSELNQGKIASQYSATFTRIRPNPFYNFNKFNNKNDYFAKIHCIYITIAVGTLGVEPFVVSDNQCEEFTENETCGLLSNAWFPFKINWYLLYVLQVIDSVSIFLPAGTIAWSIAETVQHLVYQIECTKFLFLDALDTSICLESRRKKMKVAVDYHKTVLKLEFLVNQCFKNEALIHMLMTSCILGTSSFGFIRTRSPSAFIMLLGWFIGLCFICNAGERLISASTDLGSSITQLTNWNDFDKETCKDLIFIIMRTQKPVRLLGGHFGTMSYNVAIKILKAATSYITLLKETSAK